ncbi:hypothetical protein L873DRAFT_884413 [Choiromyces venosus 120613-1]|uniref:Uncharacterized protein n=1 Tax=Choiromyces venosus 120613-1 TaxID=1336337 RepID=A0A3N4JUF2_9PEZI|nr:hypothetical protein L873DRAFT_884413 [Choiromyces venosus 120613-1]
MGSRRVGATERAAVCRIPATLSHLQAWIWPCRVLEGNKFNLGRILKEKQIHSLVQVKKRLHKKKEKVEKTHPKKVHNPICLLHCFCHLFSLFFFAPRNIPNILVRVPSCCIHLRVLLAGWLAGISSKPLLDNIFPPFSLSLSLPLHTSTTTYKK